MTERRSTEWLQAQLKQPKDWKGKKPLAILSGGKWEWTDPPSTEDDVERGCLHVANWSLWVSITELVPRASEVLSKPELERAVRIAMAEVEHRKLSGVWCRTSAKARSRNAPSTPDYHFYGADGSVTAIEFKGPDTPVRVGQAVLAEMGASTIIGPDDLDRFHKLIRR